MRLKGKMRRHGGGAGHWCGDGPGLRTRRRHGVATDIDQGKLTALTGVTPRKLDVLDKSAIDGFAKETGPIDVLFNCAGFVHHGAVLDATDEQWQFAFNLNVRSMFWTIRLSCPACWRRAVARSSTCRRPPPR